MKQVPLLFLSFLTLLSIASCMKSSSAEKANGGSLLYSPVSEIPIESAVKKLNEFLLGTKMTKAEGGVERHIISIEPHYSPSMKDEAGNAMPDAYLVNYGDDQGFAILGANSQVDPVVAVVERGNTSWSRIFNPPVTSQSAFDMGSLDSGINPELLLSMCVRGALYGVQEDTTFINRSWNFYYAPLTTNQAFGQQITYCHKNNRGFVTNGCASTAISIVMAYNQYPDFWVDYEPIDYTDCNSLDGVGYKYSFSDGNKIYIQLNDYFTNSGSIPSTLTTSQKIELLTQADPGVVNTHGTPSVSSYPNQSFNRTRYKLQSGVFYKLSNIIQSWAATGTMPSAVQTGLEDLGYENVSRLKKSSMTGTQIVKIMDMIDAGKPVIMCGWSLFDLDNSHYWVVDGLRGDDTSTHIHCNWGWSGYQNGWFSTTCIRPTCPVPTSQSGNDWGNIIVYSYDMKDFVPTRIIHQFADNIPVQYE